MEIELWIAIVYIAFILGMTFGIVTALIVSRELRKCEVTE